MSVVTVDTVVTAWEGESSGMLNLFAAQVWIKAMLGKMHK